MVRRLVLFLILSSPFFALAEKQGPLYSGTLLIQEARKIKVKQNGGEDVIRFSPDGKFVYRVSLTNIYKIDVSGETEPEEVFNIQTIPMGSWLEGLELDKEKGGWFILLGHVDPDQSALIYHVDENFQSPQAVLKLNDVVPNPPSSPVNVHVFKKSPHTNIYVLGYSTVDEKRLVFFRKTDQGFRLIRSDIFTDEIKSFAFSTKGDSGVAVAKGVAVFYVVSENGVLARRIFSVADTARPQVAYRKSSGEFVFVSRFELHTLQVRDKQPVLLKDQILNPDSGRAFWGAVAVADHPGIVALAEVYGAGFYDLASGDADTFVKGDVDYDFLYGNFSAHSVAVSPDGSTFVFNGVNEVGVVKVGFSHSN